MKTAILASLLGLTTLFASAVPAPADDIRKRDVVRRQISPSSSFPIVASASATASASVSGAPSASASELASASDFASVPGTAFFSSLVIPATAGTARIATPTGTSPALRLGGRSCANNGELVCNGEGEFGICNWGRVRFAPVARGTACREGKIKFVKN